MSNIRQKWDSHVNRLLPRWVSPNQLTWLRLGCVPLTVGLIAAGWFVWGVAIFALAALCDALDGALARSRHQQSAWGSVLDPLADKLLVILTLTVLLAYYPYPWLLLTVVIADILIALGASLYSLIRPGVAFHPTSIGKAKMVVQALAVLSVLASLTVDLSFAYMISAALLLLTIAMIIAAIVSYLRPKSR